jgi:predicted N-acetyltransferase YhbS
MSEIRKARPDEYEAILRMLGEAYGVSPDFFPIRFPSWWGEYTDFSRILVLEGGGRIESLVRIFPLNLVLGEATLSVGGIGAVSTLPAARGQGHMHHLMYRAIEEMKEEFSLSILWGDRQRYRLFGYEHGGSSWKVRIEGRGLVRMGVKPLPPQRYYGEPGLLRRIQECRRRHPFGRRRAEHEDRLLYEKFGILTWTAGDEDHFGYLVLSKEGSGTAVAEFGGHPLTVLGLVAYLFATSRSSSLIFPFPMREFVSPEYWQAASSWSVEAAASMKILHLSTAIELFRPWLSANPHAADPDLLSLPDGQAVERLFGVGRPGAAPFFCWPLDHV